MLQAKYEHKYAPQCGDSLRSSDALDDPYLLENVGTDWSSHYIAEATDDTSHIDVFEGVHQKLDEVVIERAAHPKEGQNAHIDQNLLLLQKVHSCGSSISLCKNWTLTLIKAWRNFIICRACPIEAIWNRNVCFWPFWVRIEKLYLINWDLNIVPVPFRYDFTIWNHVVISLFLIKPSRGLW